MTTPLDRKIVNDHRKRFGEAHAKVMQRELRNGKTVNAAHKIALKETGG